MFTSPLLTYVKAGMFLLQRKNMTDFAAGTWLFGSVVRGEGGGKL